MKRHSISFVLVLVLALVAAACEDPVAPLPIDSEEIDLEMRDLYTYVDGVLTEQVVEFTAVVSDSVPAARLDSITELEVVWPNRVVRMPIPPVFAARAGGGRAASMRVPREQGLFPGTYQLVLRFVDGRDLVIERFYSRGRRLGVARDMVFYRDSTWASLSWRAPYQRHDWSVRIERLDPPPVDTVFHGPGGSAASGGLSAAMDYAFQAGVTYGFVLDLENDYTVRKYVYTILRE